MLSTQRTIPLAAAFGLLGAAAAVIVDGAVSYASLADLAQDPENQFLRITWTDEEGKDFAVTFAEGPNATVGVQGACLCLTDSEGEETAVTLLIPANLDHLAAGAGPGTPEEAEAEFARAVEALTDPSDAPADQQASSVRLERVRAAALNYRSTHAAPAPRAP